ncbi:TOM (translocase of outer membrane) complex component [Nowakowskiella sp. JEL0407]|nr:TOM (translocase of outer membrane) complex component [Nowakowskiella sp. JEL0407]
MADSSKGALGKWVGDHWKTIAAVSAGVLLTATVIYVSGNSGSAQGKKKPRRKDKPAADKPAASAKVAPKANEKKETAAENRREVDINSLTKEERLQLAKEAKTLGNKFYGESKIEEAIKMYTRAIELFPDAVYYSNRAACYASKGLNDKVVEDCNQALALDPRYIKAMSRRGQGYENLGKLDEALIDFTVVCVLEEFKNEKTITSTDRVLREIGTIKAAEAMKSKQNVLPSNTFITAYMDSFRRTSTRASTLLDLPTLNETDAKLKTAYQYIVQRKYQEAHDICMALNLEDLSEGWKVLGYNLSGTLHFLRGETMVALDDFNKAAELDPKDINTLIKRASVYMEKGEIEKAVQQFDEAKQIDSSDPDLFYHRGQVRFLTGDLQGAIDDYQKSISLDPEMLYANIQLGVSQYKLGDVGISEATFIKATRKFKDAPEIYNYHGEILLDQQKFDEALVKFDKAIELDPKSPLPYINKAILHLQWKQDVSTAEELCIKATKVDPLCDIAYAQLAQLQLQQNKIDDAIKSWDEAIKVTRTEMEVTNAIQCREAAKAQLVAQQKFPESLAKLKQF